MPLSSLMIPKGDDEDSERSVRFGLVEPNHRLSLAKIHPRLFDLKQNGSPLR